MTIRIVTDSSADLPPGPEIMQVLLPEDLPLRVPAEAPAA
jgi:fatty acid-binding protein DegV